MPTILQSETRKSIESLIRATTDSSEHIAIDVYRTLRDEAGLLFELQNIYLFNFLASVKHQYHHL